MGIFSKVFGVFLGQGNDPHRLSQANSVDSDDLMPDEDGEDDDAEIDQDLLRRAKAGNADAQYELGLQYFMIRGEDGAGVKKALNWCTKAANQGYAKAQCQLGYMYSTGEGVPQDYKKAVEWYTKAANQGNDLALNNLGASYLHGHGVPQNDKKAVELLVKSANQGNQLALSTLNRLLAMGPRYRKIIENI